jgi:hypothetical protein
MARSKYLGRGMFARSILSWTWLTVKSKCNGVGGLLRLIVLGLTCLLEPHYLICLGVPREDDHFFRRANGGCAFSWACLGLRTLPSLIAYHSLGYVKKG